MADAQKISTNIFIISLAVGMLAFVGLGIFFLIAPRQELDAGDDEAGRTQAAQEEVEPGLETEGRLAPRDGEEVLTGNEIRTLDTLRQGLVLTDYVMNSRAKVVEGSVMNNTTQPFVNVQVAFDLFDADSTRLASIRDTTSEVGPGESWSFSVAYPPEISAAHATNTDVSGTQKDVVGFQADPTYEQNDPNAGPDR